MAAVEVEAVVVAIVAVLVVLVAMPSPEVDFEAGLHFVRSMQADYRTFCSARKTLRLWPVRSYRILWLHPSEKERVHTFRFLDQ